MRFFILLSAFTVVSASFADDKPIEGDLAKLQGTWSGKTGIDGTITTIWTVKQDILQFDNITQDGTKRGATSKTTLDAGGKPHKTIDFLVLDRQNPGPVGGPNLMLGIYQFVDDDTIRICYGLPDRPSEFRALRGEKRVLFTLKRVVPAK